MVALLSVNKIRMRKIIQIQKSRSPKNPNFPETLPEQVWSFGLLDLWVFGFWIFYDFLCTRQAWKRTQCMKRMPAKVPKAKKVQKCKNNNKSAKVQNCQKNKCKSAKNARTVPKMHKNTKTSKNAKNHQHPKIQKPKLFRIHCPSKFGFLDFWIFYASDKHRKEHSI